MSKQEQLAEYVTQDIISYIIDEEKLDLLSAMRKFYSSQTYEKLMDFETGLYWESSGYV